MTVYMEEDEEYAAAIQYQYRYVIIDQPILNVMNALAEVAVEINRLL